MTQDLTQHKAKRARFSRRQKAMLPHIGNIVLGGLYRAVAGGRHFPKTVIRRAVANGLSKEHLENLSRQAKTEITLRQALSGVGENHLQRALYWHDVGVKTRARDHYLESSLWHLCAGSIAESPAIKLKCLSRCQSSYLLAAPHFQYPAQLVAITCPSGQLSGYLRLPNLQSDATSEQQPFISANFGCVVLFNGINAPKEELHLTENSLLAAGIATLSFDYPGFGTDSAMPELFTLNVEELTNSLLLFLSERPEIDMSRIAAFGTSIGGRLALYAVAKLPERFRAAAAVSPPLELLSDLNLLLPALQHELEINRHCSRATLYDLARRTPLLPLLPSMQTPLLVVGGARDLISMPEEARTIYEQCASPDKKLTIGARAGHNCYEMMPSLRHEIACWIKQRL